MKGILNIIRRKLSLRVSLWIVFFAAIIYNISLGYFFNEARDAVRQEAVSRTTQILDNISLRVEGILNRVEVATDMTEWLVLRHSHSADSMFVYSRTVLLNNPDFFNCSIAFEPYYFEGQGRYFSAHSSHVGDSICTLQEGSDSYQYFDKDWYLKPKQLDRPCWTDPYLAHDVKTNTSKMVTSYCKAVKDRQGRLMGVVSISLSLDWFAKTLSAVKPYPNSYSIMIGRDGTYLVHPDTTKINRQNICTQTKGKSDKALTALGYAMQRGEQGMKRMIVDGQNCYVFYKPLSHTGYSIAIVCPNSDIFGSINQQRYTVRIIVLLGLLLMLCLFIHTISRELKPLEQLAKKSETIASGHFDTELPDFKRIDEIGQLSHSFAHMQQSLVKYIGELKDTTAQKISIERDLRIASGIQRGMLPENFPTKEDRDDVQIYASLTPAKQVGGDLFDFYFRDEKLFFCIGDVSDKGVPASLFMAVSRAVFRTVSAHESKPDRIMTSINKTMTDMNKTHMFVTLFVGVLDLPTGRLRYCNAGHDAPLLFHSPDLPQLEGKEVGELPCDTNIPIGVRSKWKYSMQEVEIFSGSTIFLFTDGLTEAMDAQHNQFQLDRVTDVVHRSLLQGVQDPRLLIEQMTEAVHQFVCDAQQSDDLTMMAIRYTLPQGNVLMRRSLVLSCDLNEVSRLTTFVKEVCTAVGSDKVSVMQLELAIEEAVVNVINYAYPPESRGNVSIEATSDEKCLTFTIIDSGKSFDPTSLAPVDTTLPARQRSIGGLGIHLVRQIMDSINYERIGDRNILTLRKKLNNK